MGRSPSGAKIVAAAALAALLCACGPPASAPPPPSESQPVAEPAPAPHVDPSYRYRLSDRDLRRNHAELLSVGVSLGLGATDLDGILARRQAASGFGQGGAPVAEGGSLGSRTWTQFQFIKAVISCDPVVTCTGDPNPKSVANDPMIWDWNLAAAKWDETRETTISVRFFGDHGVAGEFAEEIAAMPPLSVTVRVARDATWFEAKLEQSKTVLNAGVDVLKAAKEFLAALSALIVTVLGYLGWKHVRRKRKR